jgi:hypothetical protein
MRSLVVFQSGIGKSANIKTKMTSVTDDFSVWQHELRAKNMNGFFVTNVLGKLPFLVRLSKYFTDISVSSQYLEE